MQEAATKAKVGVLSWQQSSFFISVYSEGNMGEGKGEGQTA